MASRGRGDTVKRKIIAVLFILLMMVSMFSAQIQVNANPVIITEGSKILIALMLVATGMIINNETDLETITNNAWRRFTAEKQAQINIISAGIQLGSKYVITDEMKSTWNSAVTGLKDFYGIGGEQYDVIGHLPSSMTPTVTYNKKIGSYNPLILDYLVNESERTDTNPLSLYDDRFSLTRTKSADGSYQYRIVLDDGTMIYSSSSSTGGTYKYIDMFCMPYTNTATNMPELVLGHLFRNASTNMTGFMISGPSGDLGPLVNELYIISADGYYDGPVTQSGTPNQYYIGGKPIGEAGQFGNGTATAFLYWLINNGIKQRYGSVTADLPILETGQDVVIDLPQTKTEILTLNPAQAIPKAETGAISVPYPETAPTIDYARPNLKTLFLSKFPFCLPWDIKNLFSLFVAEPVAPRFTLDLFAPVRDGRKAYKNPSIVDFDMSKYPVVGSICRWTSVISFCIALIAATRKLIRS